MTTSLEEVNFVEDVKRAESKTVIIAKDMAEVDKNRLTRLLKQYKDVFAWFFEDRSRLNPNYGIIVKEEIDKLLKVGFICPDVFAWFFEDKLLG